MYILGISAFYHDAAAALIKDGEIVSAAQEERFSRLKHDPAFPQQSIQFCLDDAGISLNDIDAVAFYDKPFIKFERLLETYYTFAPNGLISFLNAIPVWLKEKIFLKKLIRDQLMQIGPYDSKKLRLLFPEHHLSHAASAYYPSGFQHAAILTMDGVGEWATASICEGKGKDITNHKELHFPHSLGLLYSSFTWFLGFRVNSGEYKLMGLAPYGDPESEEVARFITIIKENLVHIKTDGSFWLNQKYFDYASGLKMIRVKKWELLFGLKKRDSGAEEITQQHCNLALAIQKITEEIVILLAMESKKITKSENLCLAGGVALNCVANGRLDDAGIFENIYVQPASGDAGGAIGAALAAFHIYYGQKRNFNSGQGDAMKGALLGPAISNSSVEKMARKYKAVYRESENTDELCRRVSGYIAEGTVIGWVQGKMEFGPRALGNRSIIADARNNDMKKRLNLKIKFRESFRPFAPSVMLEDASRYFKLTHPSPYMLMVKQVNDSCRTDSSKHPAPLSLMEKMYIEKSSLPAITHIDYSARIQTVDAQSNPVFHRLLSAFKDLTGCGVVINTSFNVRGEPMVNTAEDAYKCFMRTGMDYLIINNYIFAKPDQPVWNRNNKWKEDFILD